jgi:dihydrofolate reductase
MLNILVAADENNGIGKDNQLLWYLPADLKLFKQLSSGHTVIMGRKTYDSIGKSLPNRRNIVVTRQVHLDIPGCEVAHSLQQAIAMCENDETTFIVGGAEIYRQAIAQCDRIFLTRVHHQFEADAFFPELDPTIWKEIERKDHPADAKHKFAYSFLVYSKKVV